MARPARRSKSTRIIRLLACTLLGLVVGPTPGEAGQDEDLANAILMHIRQVLPPNASHSVDAQGARVQAFTKMVINLSIYPTDLPDLQATADAAIDAANNPAATADSLVRAAIAGVSTSLSYRSRSECGGCQDARREPAVPRSFESGAIHVISLPTLNLPEASDKKSCSAFDHYFDFAAAGVMGMVLDLRGNQGGYLRTLVCVAGQFLKPKTRLLRLTSRSGAEVLESPADGRRPPIALPLAIFVDEGTESGALALAAALQDAHRASLIGEPKERGNTVILNMMTLYKYKDRFPLPIGEMDRVNGVPLAGGIKVDVTVSAQDDDSLMRAAGAFFGASAQP